MSKEKKKPDVNEHEQRFTNSSTRSQSSNKTTGVQEVESGSQPHNIKKEALGRNTRQG